jgi:F-box-like
MTTQAGSSEDPMIRHGSLEQPVRGDLDNPHSRFTGTDYCGTGKTWRTTTIEMLSDDILLEIFDFYRLLRVKGSQRPWNWLRLARVCRRWRYVISMSPRRLDLQIFCKSGAPIQYTLDSWPTLPLVINYCASWKSKHMPRNTVVALLHPDRLCKIDLDVTSSMTGSIVEAIQKPCQALESIRIRVRDVTGPSILVRDGFLGGSTPHLRKIYLDGIIFPFPEIRQVLLSTNNLVELHLSKIPNEVYFSPEDLVTGLSTLVQLERLTVGFHSPASHPPSSMSRPPPHRTSLPSLLFLDFHGATEYLEELVARIDPHALCKIHIKLFNDILFEIPQFCKFMPRLNQPASPTSASITLSSKSVQVRFFHEANPGDEYYALRNSCIPLDWQLSFVTQITSQLSPLLSSVHELTISAGSSLEVPTGEKAVESTQWLELFQPFTHVTKVTVWEKQVVPGIVQALVMEDVATGVLPELTTLCLYEYHSTPSVAKEAEQFVATRRLSSRTVDLKSPSLPS